MISIRSILIPLIGVLALLWVFNRSISAIGLFVYRFTGSYFYSTIQNLKSTQKEASDLLIAQTRVEDLEKINRELILENEKLSAENQKIQFLEKALDFKNNFAYQTITASVIGRSPDSWHKQLILNKGSKDGIKLGKGVVTEKGVIGQIQKLSSHSSIVQLIHNPDWRMGVKIDKLDQYGVLSGNYPEAPFLQFITVDTEVELGDKISTSGICIDADNCPYPENFPVAKVISVERDPNVVDLVVKVEFYEDLKNVKEVFVLN